MLLGRSPGPRALLQVSALSRGTRASLTASASGPSKGSQGRGSGLDGRGPVLGFPLPTALLDSSPLGEMGIILQRQLGIGQNPSTPAFPSFITPDPHFPHAPARLTQALSCLVPSKRAPQPAMAQGVPAGGSWGFRGRHTGRAAPVGLTGVHSCTRARSLWKVRGSNWGGGGGAVSTRRGLGVLFPSLRAWGLPSHLRVGHDAVHLHLLCRFPPGSLGQRHGPQKLVRGAAARDTQDRNARNFPLEILPSAHGYHPPPSEPEAVDGASREDSEPGKGTAAARGQQRPRLARGAPTRRLGKSWSPALGIPGPGARRTPRSSAPP